MAAAHAGRPRDRRTPALPGPTRPVDGALNPATFRQRAQQACARLPGQTAIDGLALLTLDIDHFQDINDRHAQATGDLLLTESAERLRGVLRGADALARLGGDRFAVLQQGVAHSGDVKALTERMLKALSPSCLLGGAAVQVRASVGGAILGADDRDAQSLTQHAEQALLRARTEGRGDYSFYDPVLDASLRRAGSWRWTWRRCWHALACSCITSRCMAPATATCWAMRRWHADITRCTAPSDRANSSR